MIPLTIILEGDNAMRDVHESGKAVACSVIDGPSVRAILLRNGTQGGLHTASLAAQMPDGTWALIETTAALFIAAAKAFEARIEFEAEESKNRN